MRRLVVLLLVVLSPPTPQVSRCIGRCRLGSRANIFEKMQAGIVELAIYIMVGD